MAFDGRWRNLNSDVTIKLRISPKSPLLIQAPKGRGESGERENSGSNDSANNDNTIYCLTANGNHYIPGSSIKGVFRSHSEKIFYHLLNADPDADKEKKKVYTKESNTSKDAIDFYSQLNPGNQLFGHSAFRGRLTIDDAIFDSNTTNTEIRKNIAVDRFRGGSKNGALFETECITKGEAKTTIRLKNPEEWQIVWLCFLIRDLNRGNISIGAKSGIGFGEVNVVTDDITLNVYSSSLKDNWSKLLKKAMKVKQGVYSSYNYESLDVIAIALEDSWADFIKEEIKEGVKA